MPFVVGDNVCVLVEATAAAVEDVDTGDVSAVLPAAEYDIERINAGCTMKHTEDQLFVLPIRGKFKRRFDHKGYYSIVTWTRPVKDHECKVQFYHHSGTRLS